MEVKDIEKVERQKGVASTVKADDVVPVYADRVERFLRDNQTMGDEWVEMAAGKLYNFSGKNKEGDLVGSSTDMGVALATFLPEIPLITGQHLLDLYSQAQNKNPFGEVYVDFGVQINGSPDVNSLQAKIILDDLKKRGISLENGRVLDFNQLRLIADKDAGLAYKLADDVSSDDTALVSAYPFGNYIGKNGLFRASLYRDGNWYAVVDYLANFVDDGRVVRYDAQGVIAKKLPSVESDLVKTLTGNFRKKF